VIANSVAAVSAEHILLISYIAVRMTWWFIVLGLSTLVVVCVAIASYMRIRRHLRASEAPVDDGLDAIDPERIDPI
jgi:hypothetical protein